MTKYIHCEMCGHVNDDPENDMCLSCQCNTDAEFKKISLLEREGHNGHCAARMVWGDGCCECGNVFFHTTTGEELPVHW